MCLLGFWVSFTRLAKQACGRWRVRHPCCRRVQERLAGLRERLAEECRGRAELEAAHQERVRDLHKRLQAEHLLRWAGCRGGWVGASWRWHMRKHSQVQKGRASQQRHA